MDPRTLGKPRTARFLLDLAAAQGHKITVNQLARWHRAGILPTPRQRSLGRGRGTETVYPPGTDVLFLAVCEARKHKRKLHHVAWALWWDRHDVPIEPVRAFMRKTAARMDAVISGQKPLPEAEKIRRGRLSWPISGARKRVGRDRFPALLRYMLGILSNAPDNYIEPEILTRALGLKRAQKDRTIDAGPLFGADLSESLDQLAPLLSGSTLVERLNSSSDLDLEKARNEFQSIASIFSITQQHAERLWGRGAFGLNSINQWLNQSAPQVQALTILLWPALTAKPVFAAGRDKILETRTKIDASEHDLEVLEKFRAEFPTAGRVFTHAALGAALKSKKKRDHLKAALRRFRKENRKQLDAFFDKHKLSQ